MYQAKHAVFLPMNLWSLKQYDTDRWFSMMGELNKFLEQGFVKKEEAFSF